MYVQFSLMKRVLLFCCLSLTSLTPVFSQDYSIDRQLPPFDELPKTGEVKTFYEFELKTDYKLFNSRGELLKQGFAKFVDMTPYSPGKYIFKFDGQELVYEHHAAFNSVEGDKKKRTYEFDKSCDYKLYDQNGRLLEKGHTKVVDLSSYPAGVYFFDYNGIKVPYKLEAE